MDFKDKSTKQNRVVEVKTPERHLHPTARKFLGGQKSWLKKYIRFIYTDIKFTIKRYNKWWLDFYLPDGKGLEDLLNYLQISKI